MRPFGCKKRIQLFNPFLKYSWFYLFLSLFVDSITDFECSLSGIVTHLSNCTRVRSGNFGRQVNSDSVLVRFIF